MKRNPLLKDIVKIKVVELITGRTRYMRWSTTSTFVLILSTEQDLPD